MMGSVLHAFRLVLGSLAAAALAASLVACATPGPALTEDVGAIRSGVVAAREQARLSFEAANKLARDQAVERKVVRAEVTLRESDFPVPVAREDAQAWAAAFDVLDAYGAALQSLVAPERAQATGAGLSELAGQISSGPIHAKIPPSVQAVFATFAQALVQAHAEKTATDVMRRTDPAFHAVVLGMADAIGSDPSQSSSLQFVVAANWTAALSRTADDYAALPPANAAGRRTLAKQYIAAMDARDGQLGDLSQLASSLRALGDAHAAASQGRPGDALFWVGRINGWLDDVKHRVEAAKAQEASQ